VTLFAWVRFFVVIATETLSLLFCHSACAVNYEGISSASNKLLVRNCRVTKYSLPWLKFVGEGDGGERDQGYSSLAK
jgi:hypothetical protein